MELSLRVKNVSVEADKYRQINVTVEGVDDSDVLDHFSVDEVVKHFGVDEILKEIDVEDVKAFFKLVESE